MGREALVHAEVGGEAGEVRALLESSELILRGEIRRRFPKAAMTDLRVEDDMLCFVCQGDAVRLALGARAAASWAEAIAKPPPSLRAKLGLDKGAKARLIGVCDDVVLAEAVDGALAHAGEAATMLIVCVNGLDDLAKALDALSAAPQMALWAIYPKGKVTFGDTAIREALRAQGLRDTKSCAVSERLTATRYNRPSI
jgi:hypothetical protein